MKTNKIKIAIAVMAAILTFQMASAQISSLSSNQLDSLLGFKKTTVSGSNGATYRRSTNSLYEQANYVNTKYNWDEILKEYPPNEYLDQTFPGYKIDIHNSFLAAVRACFSEKRIKALADRNESFEVGFNLNQDGNIIFIGFTLDTNTVITPDELYCLEENFKKLLVFKPIRKINEKYMAGFGITTNFKEILAGEIPAIRREEERQQEKEQWEARQRHGN